MQPAAAAESMERLDLEAIPKPEDLADKRTRAKVHLKGKLAALIIKRYGVSSTAELANFLNLHLSYVPKVFLTESGVSAKWALAAAILMPKINSKYFALMVPDRERAAFTSGLRQLTRKKISQEDVLEFVDKTSARITERTKNPYFRASGIRFTRSAKTKGLCSRAWIRQRRTQFKELVSKEELSFEQAAAKIGMDTENLKEVLEGSKNLTLSQLVKLWKNLDCPEVESIIFLASSRRRKDYLHKFKSEFGITISSDNIKKQLENSQRLIDAGVKEEEVSGVALTPIAGTREPLDWAAAMAKVDLLGIERTSNCGALNQTQLPGKTVKARIAAACRIAQKYECCRLDETSVKMGLAIRTLGELLQGKLSYELEAALRLAENCPDLSAAEVALFAKSEVRPLLLNKLEELGYEPVSPLEYEKTESTLSEKIPANYTEELKKVHLSNRQLDREITETDIISRGLFFTQVFARSDCGGKVDAARILGMSVGNLTGLEVGRYSMSVKRVVDMFEQVNNPDYALAASFVPPHNRGILRKALKDRLGAHTTPALEREAAAQAAGILKAINGKIEEFKEFLTWYNTGSRATKHQPTSVNIQLRKEAIIEALRVHGFSDRQQLAEAWGINLQILGRITTGKNCLTLAQAIRIAGTENAFAPEYLHFFLDQDMQPLFKTITEAVTEILAKRHEAVESDKKSKPIKIMIDENKIEELKSSPLPYKDITLRTALKQIRAQGANCLIENQRIFRKALRFMISEIGVADIETLSDYWEIPLQDLQNVFLERQGLNYGLIRKAFSESYSMNPGFCHLHVGYFYLLTRPEDRGAFASWLKQHKGINIEHSDLPKLS